MLEELNKKPLVERKVYESIDKVNELHFDEQDNYIVYQT